jgi:hypothetical protein
MSERGSFDTTAFLLGKAAGVDFGGRSTAGIEEEEKPVVGGNCASLHRRQTPS